MPNTLGSDLLSGLSVLATRAELEAFDSAVLRQIRRPQGRVAALKKASKYFGGTATKAAQLYAMHGKLLVAGYSLLIVPNDRSFYDSWRADPEALRPALLEKPHWQAGHFAAEWRVSPWLVRLAAMSIGHVFVDRHYPRPDLPDWIVIIPTDLNQYLNEGWLPEEMAAYHRMTLPNLCEVLRQKGLAAKYPVSVALKRKLKARPHLERHKQWRAGILEAGSISNYARREGIPYQVAYYRAGVCKISQHIVVK